MKSLATLVALIAVASAIPLPLTQDLSRPVETTVTLEQLSSALQDPNTNPALVPYLENALNELMVAIFNGQHQDSIALSIPAMEVNTWTLQQLSDALESPATDPELKVYLEYALNQLMEALFTGHQIETIAVATPPGLITTVPGVGPLPAPSPVIMPPSPVIIAPEVVAPVAPAPVDAPASAASPLVQIIINVEAGQTSDPPVPKPQPVFDSTPEASPVSVVEQAPETVSVVEHAPETVNVVEHAPETVAIVDQPSPVNPIDMIAVSPPEINPVDLITVGAPETVSVVEHAPETANVVEHAPETVAVVGQPIPVNPVDVIAVSPPQVNPIDLIAVSAPEVNPIDLIAVSAPEVNPIDLIAVSAPEVNPIDILSPIPVASAGGIKV